MSDPDSHELRSGLATMAELSVGPLAVISVLLVFGYFFSTIATGLPLRLTVYWLNNWKHD